MKLSIFISLLTVLLAVAVSLICFRSHIGARITVSHPSQKR